MKLLKALLFSIVFVSPTLLADQITGKVVRIVDGDTLVVMTSNQQAVKIRLAEIDAPEKMQPWGKKSKQALSALVATQQVTVNASGTDKYGRRLGTLFLDNVNINKRMVETGNAWAYTAYVADSEYFQLQERAQNNAAGLWSLNQSQIIPPWEWRKKFQKN